MRTPNVDVLVSNLSGGNQQKVIVAREFDRDVKLVIASQPTRGIDVGSIEYIHSRIVEERDEGAAVLIVSSELEEIRALSDRIIVMFEGEIAGEFDESATTTEIGLAMLGSATEAEAQAELEKEAEGEDNWRARYTEEAEAGEDPGKEPL